MDQFKAGCGRVAAACALFVGLGGSLSAGPARYDKDSKSFRFSYTFATLPGAVGQGQATTAPLVGSVQKPTAEQEANVNALVGKVSDVLYRATAGRAKIGRLDYVDDIKDADIVVSLTGQPASAGWAIRGAINGQPGQIVFYYLSLVPEIQQDIVYTAAHETCHYIFGLTDEYTPVYAPGCPPRPGTPGCLMDNYLSGARGWMGRFCAGDHNPRGDQPQSCQAIVDKFFDDQGVKADPNVSATPAGDPRPSLIQTAIGQVRAKKRADLDAGRAGTGLEAFARQTLKALFAEFNRESPFKLPAGEALLAEVVKKVVRAGSIVPIEAPSGLDPGIFGRIKAEADRLTQDVAGEKAEGTRLAKIRGGLLSFIKLLRSTDEVSKADLAPADEAKLVKRLAEDGARPASERGVDRLVGVADITAALDRSIADDVVSILDTLGEPGIAARRDFLSQVDRDMKKFAIPGRTSSRFGLRRTRLITPDPLYDEDKIVLTQGGVFPYAAIRDRSVVQFTRLIQRSKIELVRPSPGVAAGNFYAGLSQRLDNTFDRMPPENPWSTTRDPVSLRAVMQDTLDQLQRGRLENIALLVPPGGLPVSFGDQLQVLQAKLKVGVDVRLDVVLVGATTIPDELRHLVALSRGSVLTVTDIDEVGAIAQRLKNEQTSGSWIIIPQQSIIPALAIPAPPAVPPAAAGVASLNPADATVKAARDAYLRLKPSVEALLKKVSDYKIATGDDVEKRLMAIKLNLLALDKQLRLLDKLQPAGPAAGDDPEHVGALKASFSGDGSKAYKIESAIANLNRLVAALGFDLAGVDLLVGEPKSLQDLVDFQLSTSMKIEDKGLGENLGELRTLARLHEKALEDCLLFAGGQVPIYKRVDRARLDAIRQGVEAMRFGVEPRPAPQPQLRLSQFYAEEKGEFELIVGLSRELPSIADKDRPGTPATPRRPKLTLRDPRQLEALRVPNESNIKFDEEASTLTLLVYRSEKPFSIPAGWYTPVLEFDDETYKELAAEQVNFTFSVGSSRSNIQLIPALIEASTDGTRGTLKSKSVDADGQIVPNTAVIEVQVSAPSSVLGASIRALSQRIDQGSGPIVPEPVEFADDGKGRDRVKGDGVYTCSISLAGVASPTEFRVFIQADTTDGTATYIPLDDPTDDGTVNDADRKSKDNSVIAARKAQQAVAEGAVEKFQRTTSVHFRVEP